MLKLPICKEDTHYNLSNNITSNYPHKHIRQFSDRDLYTIQKTKASVMGFNDLECSHCDAIMYPVIDHNQINELVVESKSIRAVLPPESSKFKPKSKRSQRSRRITAVIRRQQEKGLDLLKCRALQSELRKKKTIEKVAKQAMHFRNMEAEEAQHKKSNIDNASLFPKQLFQDVEDDLTYAVNQPYVVQKLTGEQIKINLSNKYASSRKATDHHQFQPSTSKGRYIKSPENEQSKVNFSKEIKTLRAIDSNTSNPIQSKASVLVGRVAPRVISDGEKILKSDNSSGASTSISKIDHISVESNQATSVVVGVQNMLQPSNTMKRKSCVICQRNDCVCAKKQKIKLNTQDMLKIKSKYSEWNTFNEPKDQILSVITAHASAKKEFTREVNIVSPTCTKDGNIIPQRLTESVNKKRKRVRIRKPRRRVQEATLQTNQKLPGFTRNIKILPSTFEQTLAYSQNARWCQDSATMENVVPSLKKTSIIREVTILPTKNEDFYVNNLQKSNVENVIKRIHGGDFLRPGIAGMSVRRSRVFEDKMTSELSMAEYKITRHDDQTSDYSDKDGKGFFFEEDEYLRHVSDKKELPAELLEKRPIEFVSDISDDDNKSIMESRTTSNGIDLSDISDEEITEAHRQNDQNFDNILHCEIVIDNNGKTRITGRGKQSQSSKEDKQITTDASRWGWRIPKLEGRLVTFSGEMSHVNTFLRILAKNEVLSRKYWTKVIVTGFPENWTREQTMETLVNWKDLAKMHFLPCFIYFTPEKCMFLVYNCTEALKFLLDSGLVVLGDGYRLNLGLRDVMFYSRHRFNEVSLLKCIVNNAYDEVGRAVNLKSFLLGSDANKVVYCPLSKVHNQLFTVRLETNVKWHQVTKLNLSSNRLTTVEGFNVVKNLPSLIELDLSDNLLASFKHLISCYGCSATSVRLEGNPLCLDFVHQDEYSDAVKVVFPKIVHLDGVKISGLPDAQRNFCPHPEAMPYVEQFLNVYFRMAEAKIPSYLQLYSVGAVMTLSCEARLKKLPQYESLPMVRACRDVRLLNELFEECFMGNTAIADELESYPPMIYDSSTFTVDVPDFTDKYYIISITGTLRVLDRLKPADCALLDFTRTFVVSSRNGVEFAINNDMWHLAEPTPERREAAFVRLMPNPQLRVQLESEPSEELKSELVEIFTKITDRPYSEGLRFLEMHNWHMRSALEYFVRETKEELIEVRKQVEEEKTKLIQVTSAALQLPMHEIDPNANCMKLEETGHDSFNSERSLLVHDSFESSIESKAEQLYDNFVNNYTSPVKVYGHTENIVLPEYRGQAEYSGHCDQTGQPEYIENPAQRGQPEYIQNPAQRGQLEYIKNPVQRGQPEYIENPAQRGQLEFIGYADNRVHTVQGIEQPIHEQMYGNFGPPVEGPHGPIYGHPNFMAPQQPMYGDVNNQYGNFDPGTSVGQPSQEIYGVPHWIQQ